MRVLIVDNNSIYRQLLAKMVRYADHEAEIKIVNNYDFLALHNWKDIDLLFCRKETTTEVERLMVLMRVLNYSGRVFCLHEELFDPYELSISSLANVGLACADLPMRDVIQKLSSFIQTGKPCSLSE